MAKLWDKFKEALIGADLYDEDEYEEEFEEEVIVRDQPPRRPPRGTQPGMVDTTTMPSKNDWAIHKDDGSVSRPVSATPRRTQIKLDSPQNIEESRPTVNNIKNEIVTIINLFGMEVEEAQRIADFLAGAVDALEGNILRLNNDMFLVAPQSVDVFDKNVREDLRSKGINVSPFGFGNL